MCEMLLLNCPPKFWTHQTESKGQYRNRSLSRPAIGTARGSQNGHYDTCSSQPIPEITYPTTTPFSTQQCFLVVSFTLCFPHKPVVFSPLQDRLQIAGWFGSRDIRHWKLPKFVLATNKKQNTVNSANILKKIRIIILKCTYSTCSFQSITVTDRSCDRLLSWIGQHSSRSKWRAVWTCQFISEEKLFNW